MANRFGRKKKRALMLKIKQLQEGNAHLYKYLAAATNHKPHDITDVLRGNDMYREAIMHISYALGGQLADELNEHKEFLLKMMEPVNFTLDRRIDVLTATIRSRQLTCSKQVKVIL